MILAPALLRALLRASLETLPDEMSCGECADEVVRFAEVHLAGRDAAAAMPLVAEHLARCGECREEFEALLDGLRALAPPPSWRSRLGLRRRVA